MTFKQYITERYNNLFTPEQKQSFAPQVWQMLQKAYAPIGGLKGSGLRSEEDMVQNIPMWKVSTRDGQVKVAILYKDRNGRKLIAMGTDGTPESKTILTNVLRHEFARSYAELSGPALRFVSVKLPELVDQYAIPAQKVAEIAALNGKVITPVDQFQYTREINGQPIQKMMIGTVGQTISPPKKWMVICQSLVMDLAGTEESS